MDKSEVTSNQRKERIDEWKERGIQAQSEYAILTDEITKAWSGMTTRQYKKYKDLKKESLRDNMSTTELILNMLAETSAKEISQVVHPNGLEENKEVAKQGGEVAATAREALEKRTGKSVITNRNTMQLNHVVSTMIEASVKNGET